MKEVTRVLSNSSLINYTLISPNRTVNRDHVIDTVTIHCMQGQLSVETCGKLFSSPQTNASSNYGIGPDGRIGMYVEEKDRSWASSNKANDMRAVTIEVASDKTSPYAVTEKAYNSLIKLLVDICKRNNIKKLLWQANKSLIGKVDEQNMTVHRWFSAKACPGDFLYNKHFDIAKAVNLQLGQEADSNKPTSTTYTNVSTVADYVVEVIVDSLNIRSGPGKSYAQVGTVHAGDQYTITHIKDRWGQLKSGAGWINIDTKYVKRTLPANPYVVGIEYMLVRKQKVRTGPGTTYPAKKWYQLTLKEDSADSNRDGFLDKGAKITCKEVKIVGQATWVKCKFGWIKAATKRTINLI